MTAGAQSGLYQLIIYLDADTEITIGKLGIGLFPRGYYVYTGSAMSGLQARVRRHLSRNKKYHWHIDYLLGKGSCIAHRKYYTALRLECNLNSQVLELTGAKVPKARFGASDCRCPTHLVYFPTWKDAAAIFSLKLQGENGR